MKIPIKYTVWTNLLLTGYIFITISLVQAQTVSTSTGHLPKILEGKVIIEWLDWKIPNPSSLTHEDSLYYCLFSRVTMNEPFVPVSGRTRRNVKVISPELAVYKSDNYLPIFKYNAWPRNYLNCTTENNRLITFWNYQNVLIVNVFELTARDSVKMIFEGQGISTQIPEWRDINRDGIHEIIIPMGILPVKDKSPSFLKADIYQWNGNTYTLATSVPWENRLEIFND